ncbi:hypothetical protein R9C00_14285 [Flammeovirgaceae bacterium SG7u.111]|nr:hypothetical protein [Flammeovirgaceae bacterium SG7u.132]WPO38625.1 hypothetical protein R9C00_14285 [Flammeovirgaceae bacterium SG7u.111]
MKNTLFVIAILSIVCFARCTEEKGSSEANEAEETVNTEEEAAWATEEEVQPLGQRFPILLDTIRATKELAIASENEKVHTTKMLIEELESVVEGYDPQLLAKLKAVSKEVEQSLYSDATMQDTTVMVLYDDNCTKLVGLLSELANETPDFAKYSRANILVTDIRQAYNSDFFIRKNYNALVLEYNNLLKENREEVLAVNPSYDSLEVLPYFYEEPVVM